VTTAGSGEPGQVRLAELVAALSLGIDLGFGQPMEHVLRQCSIALRMAEQVGLDDDDRLVVYYTALLINVGCFSDAHEQAKWFGDDIALKSTKYTHGLRGVRAAAASLRMIGSGNPPLHRFRVGLDFALSGHKDLDGMVVRHAALGQELARQLGLPDGVQEAVGSSYEQWDGKGWPGQLKGTEVPIAGRVAQMAEFIEVAHRLGGIDAATALARKHAGGQFDPELAALLIARPGEVLDDLEPGRTWDDVIAAEPALGIQLSGDAFDAALTAVADFVDLKSPYLLGHARGVADLVVGAGPQLGLHDDHVRTLRRAGLVHGFGRLGVSNAIWDKAGPLGAGERERVRLQPYLTERMLHQSPALAPLGAIAVQLRERLDGSGYPAGASGGAISTPARILAAADVYQAMVEPRPHRPALSADAAAAELRAEVSAGRLDGDAVEAVLTTAGHRIARRREWPAGLTSREVEVLRLLARGLSSKEIATVLVITPKTARNHLEHIYVKIGANSRVMASMFAVQQGILPAELAG
jgi:HD-GYP domain-containing protein (c-di-GMP phosphodiesterase class II)/DNA-binding CsgD family transcriptional regulator